jgi:hypothetical protein
MDLLEVTQTISLGDELVGVAHVRAQAARYGEQIRLLEDRGLERDRAMVRQAWVVFRSLLELGWVRSVAIDAYYDAYCENGFQRHLPSAEQLSRSKK